MKCHIYLDNTKKWTVGPLGFLILNSKIRQFTYTVKGKQH